ncbi:nucleoside-diphosphate sugar epimerase/dehydratase [Vibrio tapetis subsp. quintayensis]|uniref:polysaccharide biosynthesis protein n=1 Tax=Vibrio tapetis TaxID=52443 RepID=UPI0025B3C232|nr:nucleoside-diphosphate sugar epimerase/dehydratase [Vibrio tapetis]MDN3679432.1 nucleoside-diphosphate sugar epimerase/dehydratase [Vibrio tapetis subsp. quintayensis]
MTFLNPIWTMARPLKRIVSVCIDIVFIGIAFWGAFYARLGYLDSYINEPEYWRLLALVELFTLLLFAKSGLYRAILRYLSLHAVVSICISSVLSALSFVLFAYYDQTFLPRSVPIIYGTFIVLLCGGSRLVVRLLVSELIGRNKEPVLIYGAGEAGRQLANVLGQGNEYNPVVFIDDNRKIHKTSIHGITVYRRKYLERMVKKHHIKKVLLAMPSASRAERREVVEFLVEKQLDVLTIPNFADIVNGKVSIDQLKEVEIEDLLGRDSVAPNEALLSANITDKIVMVTGAGGSIGSELCRQILTQQPSKLVLFELSEFGLYQIDKELTDYAKSNAIDCKVVPILGSVQRSNRLLAVMKSFNVQTVYHAAAYKHVPLVEFNVVEGVRNNVFGTYYTAKAAIEAKVESFVLISTDKAVRPTNVMGTTKRMAELGLQALAQQEATKESGTRFTMVRFGNVLGSSGSVIPLFKKQIAEGNPITVTHPDIIRYFMTIPEAAQLVIQAGAMGKGGDVFVLDMGEPVKIVDLATNLIQLSGLEIKSDNNPDGDVEIKFTGLRPGEKLFEELLIGDNVEQTQHERIMSANESYLELNEFSMVLDKLDKACHEFKHQDIRDILLDAPTGFNPTDGIGDLVWNANEKS